MKGVGALIIVSIFFSFARYKYSRTTKYIHTLPPIIYQVKNRIQSIWIHKKYLECTKFNSEKNSNALNHQYRDTKTSIAKTNRK